MDFVIYGEQEFLDMEVKNSKNILPNDVHALKIFLQDYPVTQAILLYMETARIMHHGILCIPVEEFLLKFIPNQRIEL